LDPNGSSTISSVDLLVDTVRFLFDRIPTAIGHINQEVTPIVDDIDIVMHSSVVIPMV
jgi:hypothetical protein